MATSLSEGIEELFGQTRDFSLLEDRRKFLDFLEQTDGGDFLAYYKKRKIMIRIAFERYLQRNPKVKEELTNGRSRKRED